MGKCFRFVINYTVEILTMDREQILQRFENLRQWGSGGERAPHKPLLVLYTIGKLLRGENRLISYADDIEENPRNLLKEFGPRRDNYNPQFPFWRLQNDGVWEVSNADQIRQTTSGDPYITDLREHNASGGFNEVISEQLQNDSELTFEIVHSLLNAHFPPSLHEDILQAVDIELPPQSFDTRTRTSNFRKNILRAYEYQCAVCGFDVKLGTSPLALEASHIKWKTYGGPNEEVNGLALCVLHHELFDSGAFTLSKGWQILVSDEAYGTKGFKEWLMNFHGKTINFPQRQSYYPDEKYIRWHVREVFQGDYREL